MNRYKLHEPKKPYFVPIAKGQVWKKVNENINKSFPKKITIVKADDCDWLAKRSNGLAVVLTEAEIWGLYKLHE